MDGCCFGSMACFGSLWSVIDQVAQDCFHLASIHGMLCSIDPILTSHPFDRQRL